MKEDDKMDPLDVAQKKWAEEKRELTKGFESKIQSLDRMIESMMKNHERLISSMEGLMKRGKNDSLDSTSGQSMPSQSASGSSNPSESDCGELPIEKPKREPAVKSPKKNPRKSHQKPRRSHSRKPKKTKPAILEEPEPETSEYTDFTFDSGSTSAKIIKAFKILGRRSKPEKYEEDESTQISLPPQRRHRDNTRNNHKKGRKSQRNFAPPQEESSDDEAALGSLYYC